MNIEAGQRALIDFVTNDRRRFDTFFPKFEEACNTAERESQEEFEKEKPKYAHHGALSGPAYLPEDLKSLKERCDGRRFYDVFQMVSDKCFDRAGYETQQHVEHFLRDRVKALTEEKDADKKARSPFQALARILYSAGAGNLEETATAKAKATELATRGEAIFAAYQKTGKSDEEIAAIKQIVADALKALDGESVKFKNFQEGNTWDFVNHRLVTDGKVKSIKPMHECESALRDLHVAALSVAIEKLFPQAEREVVQAYLMQKIFVHIRATYGVNPKLYIHCGFDGWDGKSKWTENEFRDNLGLLTKVAKKEVAKEDKS